MVRDDDDESDLRMSNVHIKLDIDMIHDPTSEKGSTLKGKGHQKLGTWN